MIISIIAAIARNNVIGNRSTIPWHLSNDLKRFKALTVGHTVIMGRKTWESIGRQPLSDRTNIVVTRELAYRAPDDCIVVHDPFTALDLVNDTEAFIIGGEQIYGCFLPMADRLYLTKIDADFEGDSFFPPYEESHWYKLEGPIQGAVDVKNPYPHTFLVLGRCR